MKVTVDRIENNIAYLELPNGTMAKVDVIVLPDCAEGDVFRIEKDETETAQAKEAGKEALKRLFG